MKNRKNALKNSTSIELFVPTFEEGFVGCTEGSLLGSAFGQSMFLMGGGKENYQFSSNEEVLARVLEEAASPDFVLPTLPFDGHRHEVDVAKALTHFDAKVLPQMGCKCFIPTAAPKVNPTTERLAAHEFAEVMKSGMFEQPVWNFFAADRKTLLDAPKEQPREYHEMATSLLAQLEPTKAQVLDVLPKAMTQLAQMHPEASTGQLYQAALTLIGRQLAPILSTIQMWTTGFRQALDPDLKEDLKISRAIVEQSLFLALTGNLNMDKYADGGDIKQAISTLNVSVGDAVLPVIIGAFDSGPAVIPMASGALGPRGGHLCFVPWNLRPVLPLLGAIYGGHETGHVEQGIIGVPPVTPKYMVELAKVTSDAIAQAVASKELVFDEPTVAIGPQQVPADKFWTMVAVGQLAEADADNWGMRVNGPEAFIKCFSLYVGAMTEVAVGSMDKVVHVLRTGSSYKLVRTQDGKVALKIEPHPQDVTRIGSLQAALADALGYPESGAYARKFTAEEGGSPKPTRISWKGEMPEGDDEDGDNLIAALLTGPEGAKPARSRKGSSKTGSNTGSKRTPKADSGKSSKGSGKGNGDTTGKTDAPTKQPTPPAKPTLPEISALISDYDKVIRVVVDFWVGKRAKKLACLNDMTQSDLVDLTPNMDKVKVQPWEEVLGVESDAEFEKGVEALLTDGRHRFMNHVTSASIRRYFKDVDGGMSAADALNRAATRSKLILIKMSEKWEADKERLDIYQLTAADVQPEPTK
jgi:hypothetical protein